MDGAQAITWFHSFNLPDGERTQGIKPADALAKEADAIFRRPVAGKTVLDVGSWDGFFAFEAEKRGASRVLATDHFCWSGPGWGTKAGFDHVHRKLGSRVESLDIDVPQISPETVGVFDVVLFLGVLYHLKDPLRGLEMMAAVTGERLVIETVTALDILPWPVMQFYEGTTLNNDATNFWAPNRKCLEGMLREVGFPHAEFSIHPTHGAHWRQTRMIVHAWR